jgi:pimeloyl-ACP methyl ester carboxylesterase
MVPKPKPTEIHWRALGGRPGGGDALVAIHGGPGLSHEYLEPLGLLARTGLPVVTYDQRGCGRSAGAVDEADVIGQAVADIERVRRAVGAPRLHLLGHSWGGLLAALYAARHPARAASLVLVDSIPARAEALAEALRRFEARLSEFQARHLVPGDLPPMAEDGTELLLAILPIYFVDPRHPAARSLGGARYHGRAAAAAGPALRAYDHRAELAAVRAPVLSITTPVPFGHEMGAAMADALPAARVRRLAFADAGHLPWLERPASFYAAVESFLADIPNTLKGDRT